MIEIFRLILLIGLIGCAIGTAITKKMMKAIIIFSSYSIIMSIIWLLLESPDLAITEAAVGAGITSILFFLTLRRINLFDKDMQEKERLEDEKDEQDQNN